MIRGIDKRDIPLSTIRFWSDMYQRQKVRKLRKGYLSDTFLTMNNVRQGGVLSVFYYLIYGYVIYSLRSWLVVKSVRGYMLLNVTISMDAKHVASKQKRCLSLMFAGEKLWHLPCATKARLLQGLSGQLHCVTMPCVDLHFYNGLPQGQNNKMKLLSNFSTCNDHRRKGTIWEIVECISRLWN